MRIVLSPRRASARRLSLRGDYTSPMAAATQIDLTQEGAFTQLPMPYVWRPPVPMSDKELMAFSRLHRPWRIERNADGDLEIMTPVNMRGAQSEAWIGSRLFAWAEEHGGITFSPNVGFTLPDTSVRSPDASWLSQEKWDALGEEQAGFGRVCPEFLIELLSKSDSRKMLEAKMDLWMANGAELAWMIDPFAREVMVYRAGRPVEKLSAPELLIADAAVPGFSLELRKLWE